MERSKETIIGGSSCKSTTTSAVKGGCKSRLLKSIALCLLVHGQGGGFASRSDFSRAAVAT